MDKLFEGKRIVVTRSREQAGEFIDMLEGMEAARNRGAQDAPPPAPTGRAGGDEYFKARS